MCYLLLQIERTYTFLDKTCIHDDTIKNPPLPNPLHMQAYV